jgi:hypothetical protein
VDFGGRRSRGGSARVRARQGGGGARGAADLAGHGTEAHSSVPLSTFSVFGLVGDGPCAAGGGPMGITRLRSRSSREFAANVSGRQEGSQGKKWEQVGCTTVSQCMLHQKKMHAIWMKAMAI